MTFNLFWVHAGQLHKDNKRPNVQHKLSRATEHVENFKWKATSFFDFYRRLVKYFVKYHLIDSI